MSGFGRWRVVSMLRGGGWRGWRLLRFWGWWLACGVVAVSMLRFCG